MTMGVGVSGPFFGGTSDAMDRFSQKFAYFHEIGHASTQFVLNTYMPEVRCAIDGQRASAGPPVQECIAPTVSGAVQEVLADLTAACYFARQPSFVLAEAEASIDKHAVGGDDTMFDTEWSGHHPKSVQRVKYVKKLWNDLAGRGTNDFANDCVPLMKTQVMHLDEESHDFDPTHFCPEATPAGKKSFLAKMQVITPSS